MAIVTGRLPSLQGTCSTTTPCSGQWNLLGGIEKARHDTPQRHKEPRALRQAVIAWCRLEAAGAPGGSGLVRLDGDFEATGLAVAIALKPDVAINKSGKVLNRVQHGLNLQLNSWSPGRVLLGWSNWQTTRSVDDRLFSFISWEVLAPSMGGAASGGDGLPI